jgi:putative DNA primase/helicase
MRTDEAARGKWHMIFEHYGLPPITGKTHYKGECPVCKGKGKLRIDDKDGTGSWVCVHGAGNGFKLLQEVTGKEFATLAKEVDALIGNDYATEKRAPTQAMDKVKDAKDRFLSLPVVAGTQAQDYLQSRGIYAMPRRGVRYSSAEYDNDAGRVVPCMFAIASNEYGEPVYKHLTYIENGKKAELETVRKMHTLQEYPASVAVKLFEAGAVLGIAEGIESALSAANIYKMPVWSAINATIMQRFRAPTGVSALYIFADNDRNGTGLAAAFNCGRANILSNNDVQKVYIRWPLKLNDFNDMLTAGDEVVEWVLSR